MSNSQRRSVVLITSSAADCADINSENSIGPGNGISDSVKLPLKGILKKPKNITYTNDERIYSNNIKTKFETPNFDVDTFKTSCGADIASNAIKNLNLYIDNMLREEKELDDEIKRYDNPEVIRTSARNSFASKVENAIKDGINSADIGFYKKANNLCNTEMSLLNTIREKEYYKNSLMFPIDKLEGKEKQFKVDDIMINQDLISEQKYYYQSKVTNYTLELRDQDNTLKLLKRLIDIANKKYNLKYEELDIIQTDIERLKKITTYYKELTPEKLLVMFFTNRKKLENVKQTLLNNPFGSLVKKINKLEEKIRATDDEMNNLNKVNEPMEKVFKKIFNEEEHDYKLLDRLENKIKEAEDEYKMIQERRVDNIINKQLKSFYVVKSREGDEVLQVIKKQNQELKFAIYKSEAINFDLRANMNKRLGKLTNLKKEFQYYRMKHMFINKKPSLMTERIQLLNENISNKQKIIDIQKEKVCKLRKRLQSYSEEAYVYNFQQNKISVIRRDVMSSHHELYEVNEKTKKLLNLFNKLKQELDLWNLFVTSESKEQVLKTWLFSLPL